MAKSRTVKVIAIAATLANRIPQATPRERTLAFQSPAKYLNKVVSMVFCSLLIAIVLLAEGTVAQAETWLAIQTPKRPNFKIQQADDPNVKLAPQLRSSVYANGSFM